MNLKTLLGMTRDFLDLRSDDVVEQFIGGVDWNMNQRNLVPVENAKTRYLEQCIPHAGPNESRMVRAVIDAAPELNWFLSYDDDTFGGGVTDKLLAVELAGPQGHFMNDNLRLGFYLQYPGVAYPNHWHEAEEIYIPLTNGTLWSRDNGEFITRNSGDIIHHVSNEAHAMTTNDAPLLALWAWRGANLQLKFEY